MKVPNDMLGNLGFHFKSGAPTPTAKERAENRSPVGVPADVAQLRRQVATLTEELRVERLKRMRLAEILKPLLQRARGAQTAPGRAYRSDGVPLSTQAPTPKTVTPEVVPAEEVTPVEMEAEVEVEPTDSLQRALRDTMEEDDDLEALLGG